MRGAGPDSKLSCKRVTGRFSNHGETNPNTTEVQSIPRTIPAVAANRGRGDSHAVWVLAEVLERIASAIRCPKSGSSGAGDAWDVSCNAS